MVSLDQQIQKDRQKHKQNRSKSRKPLQHGRDRKFRSNNNDRRPNNKHHTIRKNDRRGDNNIRRGNRDNRVSRIPRRDNDRPNKRDDIRSRPRIRKDNNGRSRIVRPPRKDSKQQVSEIAQQKGRTLKVMGLHPDFTNQDLYKLFSTEGALQKCLIEQDNFGRSLTTAIVKYHNASSAKSAIANLNQHKVMNSILTVEPYKNIKNIRR